MGTLRKVKQKMRIDQDLHLALVRSAKDEILLDIDGDGEADIVLLDSIGDGDIDAVAVDLSGDREFDLYFHSSETNGVPDVVLMNDDGDECLELTGVSQETADAMIAAAKTILDMTVQGDYAAQPLEDALYALDKAIRAARAASRDL